MLCKPFIDSASVIRRVQVEVTRIEPVHLDVREITASVYAQVSPLRTLCEQAELGLPRISSWRPRLG